LDALFFAHMHREYTSEAVLAVALVLVVVVHVLRIAILGVDLDARAVPTPLLSQHYHAAREVARLLAPILSGW
jgi:uncharacterized protein YhhL (DUF1145 family)